MPDDLATSADSETRTCTTTGSNPPGYELLQEIGRGGMGVVYRACDVALDRDVAVKLLAERYTADSLLAERFLSEARITGQLQHPGIPAVHQVGTLADGRPFLAMKLIKGRTLEAILKHRPDPTADCGWLLAIFEAVCQAVGYAHAHRVIHRDLKPANVMVGAFGEVQVCDWGLAKVLGEETPATADAPAAVETRAWTEIHSTPDGSHTQAGSLVGTPAFIPPEQALGEIEKVNERSDVFGLGALLAVILTGEPPYVGETAESVRVQAVRGKLEDCFARLDRSGAEPELVALCKNCLAFEPADRPADAGAVARAVAGFRAAANERAQRAELQRVRVEGEQATAQARAAEQRKRRRLLLAAAGVLVVAMLGGLSGVLAVQRRANADLSAKNRELDDERNKVEARFELAQKAIALLHSGVSEDMLLQNAEFMELRTKLLKEAADFYANLEKLLAGQTDAKSRKTLANGYFQLAELTDQIGSKPEALALHGKALALRRELATARGADVETRVDVARSLARVGELLIALGDNVEALAAIAEQRDLAERLEADNPTNAVRSLLAQSHFNNGEVLSSTGKLEEAIMSHRKALTILEKPADGSPGVTEIQSKLGHGHHRIGAMQLKMGKLEEALVSYRKALNIRQRLVDTNLAVTEFQLDLAITQHHIGSLLADGGEPDEALSQYRKALSIWQKLADANPAITKLQRLLAHSHWGIGHALGTMGRPAEALDAHRQALSISQKLVNTHPAVTEFHFILSNNYGNVGTCLRELGEPAESVAALRKSIDIAQKLVNENPANTDYQNALAAFWEQLSQALSQMGKPAEALTEQREALAIRRKLADAHPNIPSYQHELAISNNLLGRMLARQKQFAEAFAALDAGLAICQRLAEAEPKGTPYLKQIGSSHVDRGATRVHAGQPAEAATDLRRALEIWAQITDLDIRTQVERSRALALLAGLGGDAPSGVTAAEAKAFADQSVAALAAIIETGWALPSELKEPDFDALRGHPDFQKLFAEVEVKAKAATTEAESK